MEKAKADKMRRRNAQQRSFEEMNIGIHPNTSCAAANVYKGRPTSRSEAAPRQHKQAQDPVDHRFAEHDGIYTHSGFSRVRCRLADGSATLLEMLANKAASTPDARCMGSIVDETVVYQSYRQVLGRARRVGAFLEGITAESDIVGLCSANRIDWVVCEYATYFAACINCPILATFSADALAHIVSETRMTVLVASADSAKLLFDTVLSASTHSLKHLVLMDTNAGVSSLYQRAGIAVHSLEEIYSTRRVGPTRTPPAPHDPATICYTSGTTGVPKGVVHTHSGFIAQIEGFFVGSQSFGIIRVGPEDVYISYLPLSHVLERMCLSMCLAAGTAVAFFRGNHQMLQQDCKIIRPTFMAAVPRVLSTIKQKIEKRVSELSPPKRALFRAGLRAKSSKQERGVYTSRLWDRLVFRKIAAEFGGRLRACMCGGASASPDALSFVQAALSIKIFQGYGQTEGLAANIIAPVDVVDDKTVGIPFVTTQIRLARAKGYPEGHGEIEMRGPSISREYFNRPDETAKMFTADGWLVTGDIGKYENGRFYVVGRSRDIFKTSFGEYIVPETLETHFTQGAVEDIFITHAVSSDHLLAIVVCTGDIPFDDVVAEVRLLGAKLVAERKIARYEVPAHFVVLRSPLAHYDGGNLVTPTMKKRRRRIEEFFSPEISKAFERRH